MSWIRINRSGAAPNWDLAVGDWEITTKANPEIEDLPGDNRYGFDLGERNRTLELKDVYFSTLIAAENCIRDLDILNNRGAFTIEIRYQSASATNFVKLDGVNTNLKFLFLDYKFNKIAPADGIVYVMSSLKFRQAD